ncbi:hypothetical protein [Paracoccus jeotgali]|nr:hypothetical protein [Paracoccus jeotgali]
MVRLACLALLLLAACAPEPPPCRYGCISSLMEWEEGYAPFQVE